MDIISSSKIDYTLSLKDSKFLVDTQLRTLECDSASYQTVFPGPFKPDSHLAVNEVSTLS